MILQKSRHFNIDVNAKNQYGETAFHFACDNGQTEVAEMLIQKSREFNIDLNAKG